MPLWWPLLLAGLLFAIGVYAVLVRRNAILVLMGVELMLNAVNINFVAFDAYLGDVLHGGYTFALFVIVIAAAEIGLALAIVLMVFRTHGHIDVTELSGREDALPVTEADTVSADPAVPTTPADPATPAPAGSDRSGEVVR